MRIAVIDDHPVFIEGVRAALRRNSRFEIVGHGYAAADAVRIAIDLAPDVLLLDLNLPGHGLVA